MIPELGQSYHVVAIYLPHLGLSQGAVFADLAKEYAKVMEWALSHYRHPANLSGIIVFADNQGSFLDDSL
jgi:hypothetical protein